MAAPGLRTSAEFGLLLIIPVAFAGILRKTAANGDEIVRAALGKDLKPFWTAEIT